jgi:hypothetical protein
VSRHSTVEAVSVLGTDPDLGVGIATPDLAAAQQRAVAACVRLDPPDWDPSEFQTERARRWLGLLVVDGLLLRCVTVGEAPACELFAAGDLVRPWDADGQYDPLSIAVAWRVFEPTRLAVLDDRFAARVSPWPSISTQLLSGVARRARYLSLTNAVTHMPRVQDRLLLSFWLLAERWGKVGRDGVRITLPLTHEVLAMLIGARRPSVTVAARQLAEAGLLKRPTRDQWLLTHDAIDRLRQNSVGLAADHPNGKRAPRGGQAT